MDRDRLWEGLQRSWPARAVQGLWDGLTLPGDVYQGNVSMYGDDGRTNPQVINRAADLAGALTLGAGAIPAGANELRAGVRSGYQNTPDTLMGFRKSGSNKGFDETKYSHELPVRVTFKDKNGNVDTFDDVIKGMNPEHAYERAWRNWSDATHITPNPK